MASLERLTHIERLMSLRAKSWQLSKKEDELLAEIHSVILYRSEVDKEIDRIENYMHECRTSPANEPKGFFGWAK